jgi:hypothetical protein
MNTGEKELVLREITEKLSGFQSISLKDMGEAHLMSRFDCKYVFHISHLPGFLSMLQHDYSILVIDNLPVFGYENLYFDSAPLKSYYDHHNSRARRYKVRFRKYSDTNRCFFEVKVKSNKGLTEKARQTSDGFRRELNADDLDFLKKHLGENVDPLFPQITNVFKRITMVNNEVRERVTIDFLIHFKNGASEKSLDQIVIAEVKQENPVYHSAFKQLMLHSRIFPTSISKYCIGTVLTHPGIKYNNFKPKLIILNKICNGVA